MKKILFIVGLCLFQVFPLWAQKTTSVSATVTGYNGKVVDFEFIGEEKNNMQFPYKEGQNMEVEAKLHDVVLLKINAYIWIFLRPGDQIHADIQYEGRNYKTAEFSGTPEIVKANNAIRDMRNLRIKNRYKMNTLAALVTEIPLADYFAATRKELEEELSLLKAMKGEIPAEVYNYLYAEHESLLLANLIQCPMVYGPGKSGENIIYPDGYWNMLDSYRLHEDEYSLKSHAYMAFLLTYKEYMRRKAARDGGNEYVPNKTMKAEYEDIAAFYSNAALRENALFVFLFNQISAGRDFNDIRPLVKDFLKKQSKNKYFKSTLTNMLK